MVGIVTVLVDPPRWPAHGMLWSHLVSDTSLEELHEFAAGLGIPRRGFEGDHYDIPQERFADAVAAGARVSDIREVIEALRRSGLRMPKRKGDRGVARVRGVTFPDGTSADVDLFTSRRPYAEQRVFAAMVFLTDAAGDHAIVYSPRRAEWGAPGGGREGAEPVTRNALRELHEETGLTVPAETLAACAYERFVPHGAWGPGPSSDVLQIFRAEVPGRRPALHPVAGDATTAHEWVTWAEFGARCGHLFWWPLAAAVYDPPAWGHA